MRLGPRSGVATQSTSTMQLTHLKREFAMGNHTPSLRPKPQAVFQFLEAKEQLGPEDADISDCGDAIHRKLIPSDVVNIGQVFEVLVQDPV